MRSRGLSRTRFPRAPRGASRGAPAQMGEGGPQKAPPSKGELRTQDQQRQGWGMGTAGAWQKPPGKHMHSHSSAQAASTGLGLTPRGQDDRRVPGVGR